MKQCSRCKQMKPFDEFNKRGDGYQGNCRQCNKEYYQHYYRNEPKEKARILANTKRRKEELANFINEKKSVPCVDCEIRYPTYIMQFDHLGDKLFNISGSINTQTMNRIAAEIEKCEVVCANCHAERTYQRRIAQINSG